MTSITKAGLGSFFEASPEQTPKVSLLGYLSRLFGCAHNRPKRERFAAEREVVCEVFQRARNAAYAQSRAATKRGDTRGMNAASAELQRLTTMQLRAEVGQQ